MLNKEKGKDFLAEEISYGHAKVKLIVKHNNVIRIVRLFDSN